MAQPLSQNDGTQIDYEEFLGYKQHVNPAKTVNFTSSELYRKKLEERDEYVFQAGLGAAIGLGGASLAYKAISSSSTLLDAVNSAPGADLLNQRLTTSFNSGNREGIDPRFSGQRPLSNSLQSFLMSIEEVSPLHLMKTLQISSFSTLFVEVLDQQNKDLHIKESSITAYKEYYKNLILNSSGHNLTELDIEQGFILRDSKLYQARSDGTVGKELVGYARVVNTNTTIGDQNSPNRVFQKFANIQGVNLSQESLTSEPLAVVGAKTKNSLTGNWLRAYSRFSTEIGYKVLDNPLGFIEEIAKASGASNSGIFESKAFQKIKSFANVQLGTGGDYNLSNRESIKRMSKNIAIKSTALYVGYNGINALLDNITPEDSAWHNGIAAGLSSTYASMRIGIAENITDRFQNYKRNQEEAAPESTNLSTLLGAPLAGAMAGANLAYFHRLADIKEIGLAASSTKHTEPKVYTGAVGAALDKIGFNGEGTTLKRYSKVGALVGAALSAPFLPGALIGDSSEELREEYSGSKDVAVRSNRFWMMGGDAYEGGKIKYFRKSLLAETMKDGKNKAIYKDSDEKRALDPIFSPFRYLQNPYEFEEKHVDDMPYPVWGMDVTYGSFLGKIFEGTLGEVIKPSVVHPDLEEITNVISSGGKVSILKNIFARGGEVMPVHSEINIDGQATTQSGTYQIPVQETKEVKSLVSDGSMYPQISPLTDTSSRTTAGTYSALSDFTGLKGFTSNMVITAGGLSPEDQLAPELARSGSGVTAKDTYRDLQLGDAMGCFIPSTKVMTSVGYKRIDEISVGDEVLSENLEFQRVNDVFIKAFKRVSILKVTVEGVSEPIICTPDHVFPGIKNFSSFVNVFAEDSEMREYSRGDFLILAREKEELVQIISVESIWYTGFMYDLNVENTPYYTVNDVVCHNSGEFIRRLIPQSAGTNRDTINPMGNAIAPSWLPADETKYYKNFAKGNYWDNQERGETQLPGQGYAAMNEDLKNVDPEDYPLAYQYKILQNVARGSSEHLALRDYLTENLETLSDKDREVFFEGYAQEKARDTEKKFFEYKTDKQKSEMSLVQRAQNSLWESFSHKESPFEPLTPLRPMSKFVHQRTAIEDYIKTQIQGPDSAIWTKPVDHFIKPTQNRLLNLVAKGYKPEEVKEKERVDEFFDKLEFLKARRSETQSHKAEKTVTALAYTGIRDAKDMRDFKSALPSNQRAYVEAFSKEKDAEKREQILRLLPKDIARGYQSIWSNIDTYDQAKIDGKDPERELKRKYDEETEKLKASFGIKSSSRDERKNQKLEIEEGGHGWLEKREKAHNAEARAIRMRAAEAEAEQYVKNQLGSMPGESWIGWDERLSIDDIKLKTLSIGKEDIHRYGYWDKDLQKNDRIKALDDDKLVVGELKNIKKEMKANRKQQHDITVRLRRFGFEASRVDVVPASQGSVKITNEQEYLETYNS